MSLLSEAMETCVMLEKTTVADNLGSNRVIWNVGPSFSAAIVYDTSIEARQAQAAGVENLYTVTTRKSKVLEYHDVFKRLADGKIFRVTSDGDDKATPDSATLNMRQVTAEEFIPTGG